MPKAPSGRELPTESGEGERVAEQFHMPFGREGSFRHASRATSLPEGGLWRARLRVAGNNCMAGRSIKGALVRSQ